MLEQPGANEPVAPSPADVAISNTLDADAVAPSSNADVAVVLLVDRSGSMTGPKLDAAKDGARATLQTLGADALLAVVAFDTSPQIEEDVDRLEPSSPSHAHQEPR